MEKYMKIALKEAKKAYNKNEVPIGAVIVKNGEIISKAHNKKEKTKNCIQHAEIIAIKKACRKLKNWRLIDCTLYVTMEPCMMCCGAILESRITKLVYGIENINNGNTKNLKNIEIIKNICEEDCKDIITKFFREKRNLNL